VVNSPECRCVNRTPAQGQMDMEKGKKASASGCRHVNGQGGVQKKTELVKETI